MPQISINTDNVLQGHSQFLSASQDIQGSLGQIKSALTLINDSFQGEGAAAFAALMEEWNTDSIKVTTALEDITVALKKVIDSFSNLDQSIKSAFN